MSKEFNLEHVYSEQVTEMVTVAGEYCTFVENIFRFSKIDFLDKARKMLALVYVKMSALPKFEAIFEDENEKFVTEEDWDFIHSSAKKKLGFHDEYREVFDPLTHEQLEQSTASISDNLADVYQDLKNFINLYNIGNEEMMNDAIWECQMNFEEFWGQKLLNALKAIHSVFYSGEDLSEEDENRSRNDSENDRDTSSWIISKRQDEFRKEED